MDSQHWLLPTARQEGPARVKSLMQWKETVASEKNILGHFLGGEGKRLQLLQQLRPAMSLPSTHRYPWVSVQLIMYVNSHEARKLPSVIAPEFGHMRHDLCCILYILGPRLRCQPISCYWWVTSHNRLDRHWRFMYDEVLSRDFENSSRFAGTLLIDHEARVRGTNCIPCVPSHQSWLMSDWGLYRIISVNSFAFHILSYHMGILTVR